MMPYFAPDAPHADDFLARRDSAGEEGETGDPEGDFVARGEEIAGGGDGLAQHQPMPMTRRNRRMRMA